MFVCLMYNGQSLAVLEKMGKHTGITSRRAAPMNGVSNKQCPLISEQVVIGSPGTIRKWVALKKQGLSGVQILVFDEADHMLDEVLYPIMFL